MSPELHGMSMHDVWQAMQKAAIPVLFFMVQVGHIAQIFPSLYLENN
jgi:hypothetical protein